MVSWMKVEQVLAAAAKEFFEFALGRGRHKGMNIEKIVLNMIGLALGEKEIGGDV